MIKKKRDPKYKVVISDRIRFDRSLLPASVIKKRYSLSVYIESTCDRCDNKVYRHNELCDKCPAFSGKYTFFSKAEAAQGVWSIPQGDILAVKSTLKKRHGDKVWFVDERDEIPFHHKIKFISKLYGPNDVDDRGKPRSNQQALAAKWLQYGHGAINAKARSGKTVVSTYLYVAVGDKTIVTAHQKEFLKQFYETATGNKVPKFRGDKRIGDYEPAQRRRATTNIAELQRKTGKEIIRYVENFSQLAKSKEYYDIILIPYQSLMRDSQRIMRHVNGRYSTLVVDEQHHGSAAGYLKTLAQFNVRRRLTVSATNRRKDSRDLFGAIIMGPVVARSKALSLAPEIYFEKTGYAPKKPAKQWVTMLKHASYDKKRMDLIIKKIFEDLRAGHKCILVPVDFVVHAENMVKRINKFARHYAENRGEDWPDELAKVFHSKVKDRDGTIEWVDDETWDTPNDSVREDKRGPAPRVLVARGSMIKEGIDWARPTAIHISVPMSAVKRAGSPDFYQLVNRVCTPIAGKRQPIVRIYVDEVTAFKSALTKLLWFEIFASSQFKLGKKKKIYQLDAEQLNLAKQLLKIEVPKHQSMVGWV